MSSFDSFVFLGVTVAFLWVLWLLLNLVFELIEFWHDSLREDRYRKDQRFADFYVASYAQPSAEDGGEQSKGKVSSGS